MEDSIGNFRNIEVYEDVKNKIFFRLLNTKKNLGFLKDKVHFEILDLSMVICILIKNNENRIGSIPVQNSLLALWGVSVEEVKVQAEKNTPLLFPFRVLPFNYVAAIALKVTGMNTKQADIDDIQAYIITNAEQVNGFSAVLYPRALERIVFFNGRDIYILPMSIHEGLLIPIDIPIELQDLQEIVKECNASMVDEADILSDNVYYYNRQKNELSIAGEEGETC